MMARRAVLIGTGSALPIASLLPGHQLADEFKVLEGAGKQRRHIKLHTPEDLAAKQVAHYLGLACSLSNSPKRQ